MPSPKPATAACAVAIPISSSSSSSSPLVTVTSLTPLSETEWTVPDSILAAAHDPTVVTKRMKLLLQEVNHAAQSPEGQAGVAQRPLLSGAGLTKHLQELAKESAATEAHLANRKAMLATAQQRLHVSVRQQEAERLELFHQHMTYLEEAKRHHREQQLGFQRALHERFIKSPTSLELQAVYRQLGERALEAENWLNALSEQCLATQSPIPPECMEALQQLRSTSWMWQCLNAPQSVSSYRSHCCCWSAVSRATSRIGERRTLQPSLERVTFTDQCSPGPQASLNETDGVGHFGGTDDSSCYLGNGGSAGGAFNGGSAGGNGGYNCIDGAADMGSLAGQDGANDLARMCGLGAPGGLSSSEAPVQSGANNGVACACRESTLNSLSQACDPSALGLSCSARNHLAATRHQQASRADEALADRDLQMQLHWSERGMMSLATAQQQRINPMLPSYYNGAPGAAPATPPLMEDDMAVLDLMLGFTPEAAPPQTYGRNGAWLPSMGQMGNFGSLGHGGIGDMAGTSGFDTSAMMGVAEMNMAAFHGGGMH